MFFRPVSFKNTDTLLILLSIFGRVLRTFFPSNYESTQPDHVTDSFFDHDFVCCLDTTRERLSFLFFSTRPDIDGHPTQKSTTSCSAFCLSVSCQREGGGVLDFHRNIPLDWGFLKQKGEKHMVMPLECREFFSSLENI